jgi:hypothetical protein
VLTSYLVKCPHPGCEWFGSLLPSGDSEAWRGALPKTPTVRFQCPRCEGEWRARVAGDDVVFVALEETALPVA